MIKHIFLTRDQKDRPDRATWNSRMVFHSHDDLPMICEVIFPVGNGRLLCSTRRERMVEVCPCNTYICIVCTINNHQMDNLEGTSRKINTLTENLILWPLCRNLHWRFRVLFIELGLYKTGAPKKESVRIYSCGFFRSEFETFSNHDDSPLVDSKCVPSLFSPPPLLFIPC